MLKCLFGKPQSLKASKGVLMEMFKPSTDFIRFLFSEHSGLIQPQHTQK
jgi:hypothetical protein